MILALARGIDLGLDAAPGIMVRGDREALRILVRNLVDNAVRYTPPRRFRAGALPLDGRGCAGRGRRIRDPASPRPIESGFSIAFIDAPAAQESGTGLGLAIVKSIAEHHGARVALAEAPGRRLAGRGELSSRS